MRSEFWGMQLPLLGQSQTLLLLYWLVGVWLGQKEFQDGSQGCSVPSAPSTP